MSPAPDDERPRQQCRLPAITGRDARAGLRLPHHPSPRFQSPRHQMPAAVARYHLPHFLNKRFFCVLLRCSLHINSYLIYSRLLWSLRRVAPRCNDWRRSSRRRMPAIAVPARQYAYWHGAGGYARCWKARLGYRCLHGLAVWSPNPSDARQRSASSPPSPQQY